MDETLEAKILDVLKRHYLMALATIRPDGFPQATTVNYVHEDLTLYFAADAASQKAGNIKLNNKVSAAITSETRDFYKLRGLSLSGLATRIVDEQEAQRLSLKLFRALPQSRRFVPRDPKDLAVFAITPVAIALVDYASGFGKSYLLELPSRKGAGPH
ncbi:MAG: pyridoxamine 5'-phosphate oxidase family protein [Hyphomicrobiaceae bacterium]|nr:pyridoxamine 5'-phosphate oxidase family protein [Hyphomicrobiaceae bacterium]